MYSQLLHGRSHEQDEKKENKEKGAKEAWRRASFQTSLRKNAPSVAAGVAVFVENVLHGVARMQP